MKWNEIATDSRACNTKKLEEYRSLWRRVAFKNSKKIKN